MIRLYKNHEDFPTCLPIENDRNEAKHKRTCLNNRRKRKKRRK